MAAALAATLLLVDWWRLRRQHAVQPCRLCAPGHSNHPTCAAPPQTPHAQHAQQRQQQAQPVPCGPAVQPAKQPAADAPALTRQPSVSLRAARSISPSPFAAAAAAASFAAATPPAQQPLSLLATGSSAGAISKRCSGASSGFSVESALERRPSPPHLSAMLDQIPFLQPRQPAELAGSTAAKADATTPPSIPALQRTLAAGPRDTPSPPRRATSPLSCRASLEDLRQLLRASEAGAVPQLERKLSEQLGRGAGADRQADAGAELESSGSGRELPVLSDWEVAPHGGWLLPAWRCSWAQALAALCSAAAASANAAAPASRVRRRAGDCAAPRRHAVAAWKRRLWQGVQGYAFRCAAGGCEGAGGEWPGVGAGGADAATATCLG